MQTPSSTGEPFSSPTPQPTNVPRPADKDDGQTSSDGAKPGPKAKDKDKGKGKVTSDGFVLPSIHDFPPFFTQQPNPTTWASQSALWAQLILSYCQHARIFRLDAEGQKERESELFSNRAIDRRLSPETLKNIFAQMVKAGQAEYEPPRQTSSVLVYWRRPDEWGEIIYHWVVESGLNGSIMTLFELTDGDAVQGQEFTSLPASLLRRALDSLARQGKAQTFRGTEGDGDGVKFV